MKTIVVSFVWFVVVAGSGPRAEAKGCHETSYVVGLEHCFQFGEWSRDIDQPRVTVGLGYTYHAYLSQPFALGATTARSQESDPLATSAGAPTWRVVDGIGRFFYTGAEFEIGWIQKVPTVPGPIANDNVYLGTHAIAGVHTALFRLGIAGELAAGLRYEDFANEPSYWMSEKGDASQTRLELEARIRFDAFISPNLSIGTTFGKSLLDTDDHMVMIDLAVHIRPMDGM